MDLYEDLLSCLNAFIKHAIVEEQCCLCVYMSCVHACMRTCVKRFQDIECHQFLNAMAADNEDAKTSLLFFFKLVIDLN